MRMVKFWLFQVTGGGLEEDEMPTLPLPGGCLERSHIFNVGRQVAAGMVP